MYFFWGKSEDSRMFWISCGAKWRPFLADKRGFLGAEQSINFIGFAFLGVARRFRVIEVTFEVLIKGDNEDAFMTSHIAPVIEISRA